MEGAPYRPRPEGRFLRFTRPAARLIETFGTGFLPRSFGLAAALLPDVAHADGYPVPGQIGFQETATPIADEIEFFPNWIWFPIIPAICLFVLGLLIYIIFRFNEKANPAPAATTHHTALEVAWTVPPVMILVVIAIPPFRLLTRQLVVPRAGMTMKVTASNGSGPIPILKPKVAASNSIPGLYRPLT